MAGAAAEQIRDWMLSLEPSVPNESGVPKARPKTVSLNVAGPRESGSLGIFAKATNVLLEVFVLFRNWSGGDLYSMDDDFWNFLKIVPLDFSGLCNNAL